MGWFRNPEDFGDEPAQRLGAFQFFDGERKSALGETPSATGETPVLPKTGGIDRIDNKVKCAPRAFHSRWLN
jgi:hypothetical protein